jgi:hypothetical protein
MCRRRTSANLLVSTLTTRSRQSRTSGSWMQSQVRLKHSSKPLRHLDECSVRLIVDEQLWPSGDRKLRALADHRREAERLIAMGDRDAAQEQVRATLTTAARGLLLATGVFPLARSELPGQLKRAGYEPLAEALSGVIHETPARGPGSRRHPARCGRYRLPCAIGRLTASPGDVVASYECCAVRDGEVHLSAAWGVDDGVAHQLIAHWRQRCGLTL